MATVARPRIDSPKNPRVKELLRLHERRTRAREGRTLVEGTRETERTAEAGVRIETLLVAPELVRPDGRALAQRLERAGVAVVELSEPAFARLSRRQGPDGILAVAHPPRPTLDQLVLPAGALVLVAVGTEKPGNLGALARSADAASADALIAVEGGGTDPWNPAAIRASMGAVFSVPTVAAPEAEVRAWLKDRGLRLVAATPDADDEIWDADLTGPVALLLGPEHEGLDATWRDLADVRVRVPMGGRADSLNVAVTGALLLFEAMRQRRAAGRGGGVDRS
jgi:TrmH family RNA methyltransferase